MKKVFVKSIQPNVKAIHRGNPSYELEFENEPIEVPEEVANHLIQNPTFQLVGKSTPVSSFSNEDYEKELIAIKGIGPKTARDIMVVYSTKTALIEAIERNDHLAFDDGVCEALVKKYGGV